jgi:hypothetical protein
MVGIDVLDVDGAFDAYPARSAGLMRDAGFLQNNAMGGVEESLISKTSFDDGRQTAQQALCFGHWAVTGDETKVARDRRATKTLKPMLGQKYSFMPFHRAWRPTKMALNSFFLTLANTSRPPHYCLKTGWSIRFRWNQKAVVPTKTGVFVNTNVGSHFCRTVVASVNRRDG